MSILLSLLLAATITQAVPQREVTALSFHVTEFKEVFNSLKGKPRLVGVFSPTCSHCLQTCSELQQILDRHPNLDLAVFLLWGPYMRNRDNQRLAQRATPYLPDQRVHHFWDVWRFAGRTYSDQLGIPEEEAWDMFVFYKPLLEWEETAPGPTFWMQNRNLETGEAYDPESLEKEILEWFN
jgi:hypothetical protein